MATPPRAGSGEEPGRGLQRGIEGVASQLQLEQRMRENPYPVLGIAFSAGYIAGGGFFSHLTRPLARALMGALLWPRLRQQLLGFAGGLRDRLVSPGTAQA